LLVSIGVSRLSGRSSGTSMMSLVLKCLLGAVAVLIIALLSRSRSFFIAGLVPLFPTFALIAHYIVGSERAAADLRTTALFGLWSLIPYAIYLFAVYWLSTRLALTHTLLIATFSWAVAAAVLLLVWSKLYVAGA
jgi:membrane protein GlpM